MKLGAKRLSSACGGLICMALIVSTPTRGQSPSAQAASPSGQSDFDTKIRALTDSLEQTRAELSESRQEIRDLRNMLEQVMQKMGDAAPAANESSAARASAPAGMTAVPQATSQQQGTQISSDDWQILNARVDEQAQDKVESSLKYRVKLSGMVLLNAFGVSGEVDNVDVPTVALPHNPDGPSGSVGASFRQSIIGITGIGPQIWGADTVGDIQMDFFGGEPTGYAANTSGLVRLRVARLRLNWTHTSLFGGIDVPFFAPNSPTSYMAVGIPTFASAGNLWTWTPAIGVEQRVDAGNSQLRIDAGLMDPPTYGPQNFALRAPSPQEGSRQPTTAVRFSENGRNETNPISFGVSAIYSPQRFEGGATVSGWGVVADWRFPLSAHAEVSGEFFTGKGIDAFGGVPTPVPPSGDYNYYAVASPALEGVTTIGGWSQLKIKVNSRNEFNAGIGTGGRNSGQFRDVQLLDPAALASLSPRNEMLFLNYIFRPRSDLLFSPEFRRLKTYPSSGSVAVADQIGLAAAFLF
jgi:hypothetical protein